MKEKILNWVNLFLMIDLFFVLFCFFCFVVSLIARANNFPVLFDWWYQLWMPVVQPALGLLMMGALVSGAASWISKRFGMTV